MADPPNADPPVTLDQIARAFDADKEVTDAAIAAGVAHAEMHARNMPHVHERAHVEPEHIRVIGDQPWTPTRMDPADPSTIPGWS